MRKVELEGTIRLDNLGIDNASVTVYKNNQFLQEIRTDGKGEFTMFLDLNCSYRMEVTAEGLITKRFIFDTKIPFDAPVDVRLTFDFIVGLFPWFDDPDLAILDQPLGIIKYDTKLENFNYDKDYTKTIITRLELLIKRYNAKIKEFNQALGLGDTYFNMAQYPKARENYVKASAIFPKEKYPIEKIAEIDRMSQSKVDDEALYAKLIEEADKQAEAKVYTLALAKYERASDLKPNEQYPKDKIYEIGKIVFSEEAQQQKYSQLILDGDNAFNLQDYTKAIGAYEKASAIKPSEQYPKDQIDRANKIIAKQKELKDVASVDDKYSQIVALADKNFNEEKYIEAKDYYIQANMIKSAEQYPKDQLVKISELLAQQKAIDEAYARAIDMGNKLYNEQNYQPALDNYQRALNYKPKEQYPKDKIAELTKLMAALNDVDKSYKDALAEGDKLLEQKKLKEAREKYVFAGTLRSTEQYPKVQVVRIDNMLADVVARQELDAKYKKYMEDGDRQFGLQQYDMALNSYQQATSLKPSEQYPKDQIAKINLIIAQSKTKEEQYAKLIEYAEKIYVSKDYNNALKIYQKALGLKPGEQLPTDRIAEINKILAAQQGLEASYKNALAEAENLFTTQEYTKAKTAYQKALDIKPSEQYPKDQMGKIDRILAEQLAAKSTDEKYKTVIAQADKYFTAEDYDNAKKSYTDASTLKSIEQYPKDQLAKINQIFASQQANEANYAKLIIAGDQLFGTKDYSKALLVFDKAGQIKPSEKYPKDKIAEINKLLAAQQGTEVSYKNAIAEADNLFNAKEYNKAKTAYQKASDIKSNEQYPKDQITKIDKLLADLLAAQSTDQKYKTLIAQADKYFTAEDYTNAKQSYSDASAVKTTEQYPKDQIAKINQMLASQQANDATYAKLITAGDQLFGSKDYSKALLIFDKAGQIKPTEKYPKDKIAEINKLLAAQQGIEASYKNAIAEADNLFTAQDYAKAKTAYQKASDIKSGEQYPKDQMVKIDKLLADQLASKSMDEKYKTLIAQADKYFSATDYDNAKKSYTDASAVKTAEQYPKDQIAKINQLLATQQATDVAYTKLVAAGDQLFVSKDYSKSLLLYDKASKLKPVEKYPQDKIAEINKLLAAQQGVEEKYKAAIAEADRLFAANDNVKALDSYTKASAIKPAEQYPKDQISKINGLMANSKKIEADYAQAIADGDKSMLAKDYQTALTAYQTASTLKPSMQYPKDKITEINTLMASLRTDLYKKIIAEADANFTKKDYTNALTSYDKASKVIPTEVYPKQRIAEINKILDSQKSTDASYTAAIATADKAFTANDFQNAKISYQLALKYKANELYPTNRIVECDKELTELAGTQQEYQKILTEADRLFSNKDYVNARVNYVKANGKKPNEAYPQSRIKEIDGIIESVRKAEYDKVIGQADYFYNQKDYKSAKDAYTKASGLMPSQQYPKDRIAEINKMMSSEGYNIALAKADQFYTSKDYVNARSVYMEALGLRANEAYPRQRIQECNKQLKQAEFASAIDQIKSEFIEANTTRKYAFAPLKNRSTSNYLSIKARNLSGKPFKIILNFGVDDSNVGGVVLNIDNNSDVVIYTPLVGEQSGWVVVANNWMSLSPIGGDIEILGIKIEQGTK